MVLTFGKKWYSVGVTLLGTVSGIAVAGWHAYLLHFADEQASCGPSWSYFLETSGFFEAVLIMASTVRDSCTEELWSLFGVVSIPVQSLALFTALLVAWIYVLIAEKSTKLN